MKGLMGIGIAGLLAAMLTTAAPSAAADAAQVNLNTASVEELEALPGVGPSKAKAIVEYRTAHPFETIEEMKNVRGIGDATFEDLKDQITVGSAPAPASAKR